MMNGIQQNNGNSSLTTPTTTTDESTNTSLNQQQQLKAMSESQSPSANDVMATGAALFGGEKQTEKSKAAFERGDGGGGGSKSKRKRDKSKKKSKSGQTMPIPTATDPFFQVPIKLMTNTNQRPLDDWLEMCLKDDPNPTSSLDLLDGNGGAFQSKFHQPRQQQTADMMNGPSSPFYLYPRNPPINPMMTGSNYLTRNMMMRNPNFLQNPDFASLPPAINFDPTSDSLIPNAGQPVDLLEAAKARGASLKIPSPNNSDSRRFSDPGYNQNSDNESKGSSNNTQSRNTSSSSTGSSSKGKKNGASQNGQMLSTLLEQINRLHETNSKICRNLHETKVEIEALKHAPSWGLRHRRDSISGLSTHSQPLGYAFGTQSPAPTFHSGMYTPGMMTDVVREVREGARVREEALINRVKTLVDERTWQANELNFKLQREVEDLKLQVHQLRKEKQDTNQRISDLEMELKSFKIIFTNQTQFGNNNLILHAMKTSENDLKNLSGVEERKSSAKKRNSLNLKYGMVNENHDHQVETLPGGSDAQTIDYELMEQLCRKYSVPNMMDSPSNKGPLFPTNNFNSTDGKIENTSVNSDHFMVQMEKDTLDLRRELQDAVAGKKHAENRIATLEKMVASLQENMNHKRFDPTERKMNNLVGAETNNSPLNGNLSAANANQIQTVSPKAAHGFCLTGPVTDL